jgi:hypothetical protein
VIAVIVAPDRKAVEIVDDPRVFWPTWEHGW